MIKKLFVSFYQTRIFSAVKGIVKALLPVERYHHLKSRIWKRLHDAEFQPVWEKKQFGDVSGRIGVNISGLLRSGLGLGESARNIARALLSQDIRFVLNDYRVHSQRKIKTDFTGFYSRDNPYLFNLVSVNPDQSVFYYMQGSRGYFEDRYNIGVWYWEVGTLPEDWAYYYRFFHEIWVATDFIQEAVSKNAPIPVVKMPTVIDVEPKPATGRSYFKIPADCCVFLFTFDFYSTMVRKNPQSIIRAFKSAFGTEKRAMLCIKTVHGGKYKTQFLELLDEVGDARNIKVFDGYLEREKMNSLINVSDCYVSLHRSEGFGMGIAEAMLFGKPVIVTAYSGNMDFTNEANSLLVKYKLKELDHDSGTYRKGSIWAEPDTEHASELMRWVFEHRDEANAIGKRGLEYVRDRYSAACVGMKIKARLDDLVKGLDGKE
jgi:glycosyltransferase involved in cell wall biosynthesis